MRMESEARLRDAQVGRAGPLHSGINDLSLNFLITKGEACPFKVTDGPDYPEKMRSNRRRALKKVFTWKTPSNSALSFNKQWGVKYSGGRGLKKQGLTVLMVTSTFPTPQLGK